MVSGVDSLTVKNGPRKGSIMPFAFGLEAPPATIRQMVKVPLPDAMAVKPGQVLDVTVREVSEFRGMLWLRGDVAVGK